MTHTEHTETKGETKDKGPSDKDQLAALVELHADDLERYHATKAAEKEAEKAESDKSGQ